MYIKGFDKNLCCRGYQFEVGKEYKIDNPDNKKLKLCTDMVFHFCDNIEDVQFTTIYGITRSSRYCEIEALGEIIYGGKERGSNHIRIIRELTKEEIDILFGRINGNTGIFNTGSCNSGDYNTGGYNSGNRNSGVGNSGNRNTGIYNSGRYNSGDCNSGSNNTGDYNSGYRNSGNCNSGSCNSGQYNSGDYNSGMFNSCDYSPGFFCNVSPTVRVFNMDTGMTMDKFIHTDFYKILYHSRITLTKWIEFTEEEKSTDPDKALVGGYLKRYKYKEACVNWWESLSKTNKAIIKEFEFFDAEVFYDITGIDLR